jgi:hypothetical protein
MIMIEAHLILFFWTSLNSVVHKLYDTTAVKKLESIALNFVITKPAVVIN